MALEGVDISSHQGDYTYPTNPDFAIIKASGGHDYRNPLLGKQVANARAKNIIVGFYHYFLEPSYGTPNNPSGGDVAREAANFIEACRPYVEPGTTFWLDVEEYPETVGLTNAALPGWIAAFCDAVEATYGCVCGVYCATWFQEPTGMTGATQLRKYPYWMASWQEEVPAATYMAPWDQLTIHQYNADGSDKDRFYGTREQFLALGVPALAKKTDTGSAPDPIVARSYINGQGQPVTEIIWAGQAVEVLGTDYVNVGVRVRNAAGQVFHRSILNGQGQQYIEED